MMMEREVDITIGIRSCTNDEWLLLDTIFVLVRFRVVNVGLYLRRHVVTAKSNKLTAIGGMQERNVGQCGHRSKTNSCSLKQLSWVHQQ